jgi:hypothetical protein
MGNLSHTIKETPKLHEVNDIFIKLYIWYLVKYAKKERCIHQRKSLQHQLFSCLLSSVCVGSRKNYIWSGSFITIPRKYDSIECYEQREISSMQRDMVTPIVPLTLRKWQIKGQKKYPETVLEYYQNTCCSVFRKLTRALVKIRWNRPCD